MRENNNKQESSRRRSDKRDSNGGNYKKNRNNKHINVYSNREIDNKKSILKDLDIQDESRLEGRNSVVEALDSGREFNKVWYLKADNKSMDDRLAGIINRLKQSQTVLYPVDRKTLDRMSKTGAHQGIIAQVAAHEYAEVQDILELAKERGEDAFIIMLDEVQDSQNLGAILRTADAAGVHGIIIPERRSVTLDATAAKTSVGAIEHVKVARVSNMNQCISELKDQGIWVAGLDMDGEDIFASDKLSGPIALVVGNEGKGIRPKIRKSCDFILEIPMVGQINSLNASNAAAISMYAVYKSRNY